MNQKRNQKYWQGRTGKNSFNVTKRNEKNEKG